MKKKTMFPNEIIMDESEKQSMIEQELIRLIDKALKERLVDLAIDDVRIIARELMPDLDKIIANKIKEHFYQIGNFLVEKFGNIGE